MVGCGKKIESVTGQLMVDGKPYQLQEYEGAQLRLMTIDPAADPPLSLSTSVKKDGSFAFDLNNHTGAGIPAGKYVLQVVRDREVTVFKKQPNDNVYKRSEPIEVTLGTPVHFTIDLSTGAIGY